MSKNAVVETVDLTKVNLSATPETTIQTAVKVLPSLSARIRYLMNHFTSEGVKSPYGATTKWLKDNGYRTSKGTEIRFQQVRNQWLTSITAKKQ